LAELGEEFAGKLHETGIGVAEGALIGGMGAIGKLSRYFPKLDRKTVEGDRLNEIADNVTRKPENPSRVEELLFDELKKLEDSISGAHFVSRHGPQTTLGQQKLRAEYGILPENPSKVTYSTDSARWMSSIDMYEGLQKAKSKNALTGDPEVYIEFDTIIGEGYLKGGEVYATTNVALFKFDEYGNPITFYPVLGVRP
jgi:hypothetical protein